MTNGKEPWTWTKENVKRRLGNRLTNRKRVRTCIWILFVLILCPLGVHFLSFYGKINDMINTTICIIGIVGTITWIYIANVFFFKRNVFDRHLARVSLGRLIIMLFLIISIPCILYVLYLLIPTRCYHFDNLQDFNDSIINPFLNHGNFNFPKSLVCLIGTVFLSGVLVSMFVNFINQRAEQWDKGETYYNFQHQKYRVVIGGHDAVPSLVKQLVEKYCNDKVIVFTNIPIHSFRSEIESYIEQEHLKDNVILYHGFLTSKSDLQHLNIKKHNLLAIYILGESRKHGEEEASHDTLNMTCLDIINDLRGKVTSRIDCYVFFEHQTTSVILQKYTNHQRYKTVNFIPYNFYELHAQKAIGWGERLQHTYSTRLDRFGKDINVDKHVHFVIIGMSRMGMALGLEALRVCHYPNYAKAQMLYEYEPCVHNKNLMDKRRTRITFIDCNMRDLVDSFRCRYERLLNEIQWRYVDYEHPLCSHNHPLKTDGAKIIPDIELEFVNGRIQSTKVVEHLTNIATDNSAVLTIASCLSKSNQSIASVLFLPKCVLDNAELMLYQSDSQKLVNSIRINEEHNVRAFGKINQTVSIEHIEAIESMAKRINNVYLRKGELENKKKLQQIADISLVDFTRDKLESFYKVAQSTCDNDWIEKPETWRWANRYHASAIWQKMHYIDNINDIKKIIVDGITDDDGCEKNEYEGLMARLEHNRYCVEQWLLDRRTAGNKAFNSYTSLRDDSLAQFPTNDQIMTMAIPYIIAMDKSQK